jgi:hypothetical protein
MLKTLLLSTALAAGTAGFAQAQTVAPLQATTIDLGAAHGTAYYVPEPHGYHVVATLDTGSATPVRFDTLLADGQSARVSIPTGVGQSDIEIIFTRAAGRLVVRRNNIPSDPVTASIH